MHPLQRGAWGLALCLPGASDRSLLGPPSAPRWGWVEVGTHGWAVRL